MPTGHLLGRRGQSPWGRGQPLGQRPTPEVVVPAVHHVAEQLGTDPVGLPLGVGQLAGHVHRMPGDVVEPGLLARRADHDVGDQAAQLSRSLGEPLVRRIDVAPPELGLRPERAGAQELDQPVEIEEVARDRGGRKEQLETAVDLLQQLPRLLRAGAGHAVGLVDDQEVPRPGPERVAVPDAQVVAHDQPIVGERSAARGDDREVLAELVVQLLAPLLAQGRRAEHEDPAGQAPEHELLHHEPRFDGLPEADLVGEDRPPPHDPECLESGALLVGHVVDGGQVDGQQLVEVMDGRQPLAVQAEVEHLRRIPLAGGHVAGEAFDRGPMDPDVAVPVVLVVAPDAEA